MGYMHMVGSMRCVWLEAGEQVWVVYGWKQVNAPRQEFPVAAARCVGAPLLPPLLLTYFLFFLGVLLSIFRQKKLTFKLYQYPYVSLVIN